MNNTILSNFAPFGTKELTGGACTCLCKQLFQGERLGREAAEKTIADQQAKITLEVLEKENANLSDREDNHVKHFNELHADVSGRFRYVFNTRDLKTFVSILID